MLQSKFRGCLVGACVGDCLGGPFESKLKINRNEVIKQFTGIKSSFVGRKIYQYSDDTAMTRSVAESLLTCKKFNAVDMADRFQKEYFEQPHRGYGFNVVEVFKEFREQNFENVFSPAKKLFDGSGSYGNGAAMRISPVALFNFKNEEEMIETATRAANITHFNHLGVTGCVLLCIAIKMALNCDFGSLESNSFIIDLQQKIKDIDQLIPPSEGNNSSQVSQVYVENLTKVLTLLERDIPPSIKEVVESLGNGVAAHKSVCTSIYSFLRGLSHIKEIEEENMFSRVILYSILLGGDTDTIASMAGSLAGAYCGISNIPEHMLKVCESVDYADRQALDLYSLL